MSVHSDTDSIVSLSDDNPAGPGFAPSRSPSPTQLPFPLPLPIARLDPAPTPTILDHWEAQRTYIALGPTATDLSRVGAAPSNSTTTAETPASRSAARDTARAVARATQQHALNGGYGCAVRLDACLTANRGQGGEYAAVADDILPLLPLRAWDAVWLKQKRDAHAGAPRAVLDLLEEQMGWASAARRADGAVGGMRTERERRRRGEQCEWDCERLDGIGEGAADPEGDEAEMMSRPAAWYANVDMLEDVTMEVDEWYQDFVEGMRESYHDDNEVMMEDEDSVSDDGEGADDDQMADDGEHSDDSSEQKIFRGIQDALEKPTTAHMALMNVLCWTEADLELMSRFAVIPAATPNLPGTAWHELMLQSITYAGRTIEALHNALHNLKHQNDLHGVPIGDTSAINRVGAIATLYKDWLLSRSAILATHISQRLTQMRADHDAIKAVPAHASIREAYAMIIPALMNGTAASLNGVNFAEQAEVVAENLEVDPFSFRDDYNTLLGVRCLLGLLRCALHWRDRAMWLQGNMSQESVHAYRTRAMRAATGRWVHWSHKLRFTLDSAQDAALGLEQHSTAARDILRALRGSPGSFDLLRLLKLARFGRLVGFDGGYVAEHLYYAALWSRKTDAASRHSRSVMLHHTPAEMDYLAATLPGIVKSMTDSPQWGGVGEEDMAVRIGEWVVPSLKEWRKRPWDDRPVGASTVLVLHYAKLVERLASMPTRLGTAPVSGSLERSLPHLQWQLRYDDCDESTFRSMADRWQNARLRLTGRLREFVLKYKDAMAERASASVAAKTIALLNEIEATHPPGAVVVQRLQERRLLSPEAYRGLCLAVNQGSEDTIYGFLRINRDVMIRVSQLMMKQATETVLLRIGTPDRDMKLSLHHLNHRNWVSPDKSSAEYQEHRLIIADWDDLVRAELILTHVCEIVGTAWRPLPAYVGRSLIQAFDDFCP
ncbi:uncharacterized protein BKCO1_830003 [Diplodia corticola]|uniref:Uncharacterized protein n=1 Tax=Diplodia corticola TaxID=236234 RepID=A0A1J9RLF4_9PEZI|nr:uncharacterized protein BKCO1_830003 [Diplodia corticola]OJD29343.1 hypothetical protein BKCO1_830003 [Diplodia corticola]